jgi:phosphopantothenoylcysteine decarboxylase/phosphopantothenate--cysteine ligase
MYKACVERFDASDGAVMCAAVADYTPSQVADQKIKKSDDDITLSLRRTDDIAASLGSQKGDRILVGFAMETEAEMENAQRKLEKKNFDFIVLNSLREQGAGFRGDTNVVTLIDGTSAEKLPLMSKRDVAERIADKIESLNK